MHFPKSLSALWHFKFPSHKLLATFFDIFQYKKKIPSQKKCCNQKLMMFADIVYLSDQSLPFLNAKSRFTKIIILKIFEWDSHKGNVLNKLASILGELECAQRFLTFLDGFKVWKRSIENHCGVVPKEGRVLSSLMKASTVWASSHMKPLDVSKLKLKLMWKMALNAPIFDEWNWPRGWDPTRETFWTN